MERKARNAIKYFRRLHAFIRLQWIYVLMWCAKSNKFSENSRSKINEQMAVNRKWLWFEELISIDETFSTPFWSIKFHSVSVCVWFCDLYTFGSWNRWCHRPFNCDTIGVCNERFRPIDFFSLNWRLIDNDIETITSAPHNENTTDESTALNG